jgi:hypothetical protein
MNRATTNLVARLAGIAARHDARLAGIAARHDAGLRGIDAPVRQVDSQHHRRPRDRRVLLPADQQRGAVPVRVAAVQPTSRRSSST